MGFFAGFGLDSVGFLFVVLGFFLVFMWDLGLVKSKGHRALSYLY